MSKQRLRLRIAVMAVWVAVTAAGCAQRDDAPFGLTGDAEVHLTVGLDETENEQTISKAGQPTLDPYRDLAVYVINTHEDTLARWACFDDVPVTLKFAPGAYKVVAEYKPEGAAIPAFDTYTYRAEEKFVIKAKDKLHVDLVARLATAKISVEFDPTFDFFYLNYSVDIRTVGVDSLRFAKGETRCGFFEPGSVRMRFNLLTPEGRNLVFSPTPLTKARAADYYKLKLKVSSDEGTTQVIIVGTDDELNPEKDITIEVPQYFLPKDKPTLVLKGFENGVSQSVFEGEVPEWGLSAKVPGGVSSFIIRLNDGASGVLASKLGGQTVIDLAGLPENDPLRAKLRAAGFVWSEGLNSPDDASFSTDVWVDFSDAMRAQEDGSAAQYDFSIEVTDNYDQNPEANHPCNVKAEIKAPIVKFMDIAAGHIWATRAFFTVQADYDFMNGVHPVLQYRKTSSSNWIDAEEGAAGEVTVTALNGGVADGEGFYSAQYALRGLQPGTEYEFRVQANDREIVPATSSTVWTTEQKLGVPGLSADGGFATGWNETASTTALGVSVQAPPAGWATRNALTTSQTALSPKPDGSGETVSVSEVSANNGTTLVYNPGNYSRKAVQLRTTGWGRGCYSKSGGDDAGVNAGSLFGGGRKGSKEIGSRVRNTSAGILYLGSYIYRQPDENATEQWTYVSKVSTFSASTSSVFYTYGTFVSETIKEDGAAFASRPATLNFQYKFTPVSGTGGFLVRAEVYAEDGTRIGGVSWTDAAEVTNMTNHMLKIDYTEMNKPAATIKLFFSSDSELSVGTSGDQNLPESGPAVIKNTDGNPHVGNVLLIDNLTLGYDFE